MGDTKDDRYYATAEIRAGKASGLSKQDVVEVKAQFADAEK